MNYFILIFVGLWLSIFSGLEASTPAKAIGGWIIKKTNGSYYLIKSKTDERIKIPEMNIRPVLKEITLYQDLELITYHGSTAGTSSIVDEYYRAIYRPADKQLLGIFRYQYVYQNPEDGDDSEQPIWDLSIPNQLTIHQNQRRMRTCVIALRPDGIITKSFTSEDLLTSDHCDAMDLSRSLE